MSAPKRAAASISSDQSENQDSASDVVLLIYYTYVHLEVDLISPKFKKIRISISIYSAGLAESSASVIGEFFLPGLCLALQDSEAFLQGTRLLPKQEATRTDNKRPSKRQETGREKEEQEASASCVDFFARLARPRGRKNAFHRVTNT